MTRWIWKYWPVVILGWAVVTFLLVVVLTSCTRATAPVRACDTTQLEDTVRNAAGVPTIIVTRAIRCG